MFTGIVEHKGKILSAESRGDLRVTVACDWNDLAVGESVAVNGVCLTVVDTPHSTLHTPHSFSADISAETLACTAPRWKAGQAVNLERALKLGDRLSGHMVSGHVDGIARIVDIAAVGDSHVFALEAPPALSRFIAAKGSVALDGVSLTVNKVEGVCFWVNIIPHTYAETTFCARRPGDALNMEIDVVARYVERLSQG